MNDTISRQAAIDEIEYELEMINSALDSMTLDFNARERLRQRKGEAREILNSIQQLPSAQSDNRLSKIAELVEGTIDHFDLDDAMDLLYQIKEVVGNETSNI